MKKSPHTQLASKLADKYFQAQCERMGELQLFNRAADMVINDMLAQCGVKRRTPKKRERAFIEAHEIAHQVAAMEEKIAKDREAGLAIEAKVAELDERDRAHKAAMEAWFAANPAPKNDG